MMSRPSALRQNRWHLAPPAHFDEPEKIDEFHPVLLQVLYNRGLVRRTDIYAFLNKLYPDHDDPFLLTDMDRAVDRVRQAIDQSEKIVVYGDFDADGVTATVLLVEALRGLGLSRNQIVPYIPDRVDEGYGINREALEAIRKNGASLVISVDCGIRSIADVRHARDIGLDVIITDHHNLGQELPPASAVVNPRRPESTYPERRLAGVGIAFKFAQALRERFPAKASYSDEDLLDLVALGTVADLVPLLGENRILVAQGLEIIKEGSRPGLEALIQVSGFKKSKITSESIAFGLAPRINAAGRLAHAYDAAKLLAAPDFQSAAKYAKRLDRLNRDRQQITNRLYEQAEQLINPEDTVLIAASQEFISGVVGLVASRLADHYYRPAIVLEIGEGESRGSCRSIPAFHITEALDRAAHLLERYGGHAQAAGFTIRNENLESFHKEINAFAASTLDEEALTPSIAIDAEVELQDVDWALHGVLEQLEPTGIANARPLLLSRNVRVMSHRVVGQDESHMQMFVGDSFTRHSCIAFRQGAWADMLPEYIDLLYTVGVNEWNGRRDLQLTVQDIREAS